MKSFDAAAKSYERHSLVQQAMADWLAEWLPTARNGIALEIAAGTGLFTRHLLPWNGNLIATDAAPRMVSEGKRQHPEAEWKVTYAENLPEIAADWIFSSSFLQWAENPTALLKHWKNRLKPDGKLLLGFFAAPTLPELEAVLPETAPLQWRPPDEWEYIFRTAGFHTERIESETRIFSLPSALNLLRTLHGIGAAPFRQTSPGKLRRALTEYDQRFSNKNGTIRSTWTFVRIESRAH